MHAEPRVRNARLLYATFLGIGMDRNALLATTRAEFLRCFLTAFDECLPRSRHGLYSAADASFIAGEQHRLMAGFKLLSERHADLRQQLLRAMDQLLNRSFQTTYSTFRPSFSSNYVGDAGLSLVDANQFEDQLHIDEMTRRFRHAAEEQLRDLNIRIAILFEQDTINERENPFRPFLIARALATAVDNMGQLIENNHALFNRLATDIEPSIVLIYEAANRHLSEHGIAAQLQLKIKKTISSKPYFDAGADTFESVVANAEADHAGNQPRFTPVDNGTRALSSDRPRRRVEQLFDMVKRFSTSGSFTDTAEDNAEEYDRDRYDAPNDHFDIAASNGVGNVYGGGGSGGSNGGGSGGSSEADRNALQRNATMGSDWVGINGITDTLRRLFSAARVNLTLTGNTDPYRIQPAPQRPISERLGTSLERMINECVPASERMTIDDGSIRNLIVEQRSTLSDATGDSVEQMTIDVVAMLFEFILRDAQIPAEVRAQLGRLQFLVLKVALRDGSLLTQRTHPARLLVNRIGTISIGLHQIEPGGVHIASEIIRIVETLLADRSESSYLFETMLDEFDAFIARELRSRDTNVERAAQAVENAESRTLRFARLSAQLGDTLTGLSIDPFLYGFLTDTWVHVIEHAERADGIISRPYRQLVPDLLWSIVPKNSAVERSKLITLLPVIVGTVRQGLTMDGWDEPRQRELLDWLVTAHSSALRSVDTSNADLQHAAMNQHFDTFLTNLDTTPTVDSTIDPVAATARDSYLFEAINEVAVAVDLLDPLVEMADTLPMEFAAASDPALPATPLSTNAMNEDETIEQLRNGVAIDITLGTEPVRANLCWKTATTLVLTLDGNPTPSMISVRMFLRLCEMRRARFVESAPLFERAVHSLLTTASEVERRTA